MNRFRITVRGLGVELRGRFDELTDEDAPTLRYFAEQMEPFGIVVASPAEDDFDPFKVEDGPDMSIEAIRLMMIGNNIDNLPDLIRNMANVHYMQAQVIQGERALRESAEAELRDRELHHFETEEKNARFERFVEYVMEIHRDDGHGDCGQCGQSFPCSEFLMAQEAMKEKQ